MLDVINRVSNEYESDEKLYNFLLGWLDFLNNKEIRQEKLFLALSLWQLLSKIGFTPNINSCVRCQSDLLGNYLFYQNEFSGFVCQKCALDTAKKVSSQAAAKLKGITDGEEFNFDLRFFEHDADLPAILLHHIETILEFEIRGFRVYNEVVN